MLKFAMPTRNVQRKPLGLFICASLLLHAGMLWHTQRTDLRLATAQQDSAGQTLHVRLQTDQPLETKRQPLATSTAKTAIVHTTPRPALNESATAIAPDTPARHSTRVAATSTEPAPETPVQTAEARARVLSHVREDFSRHFYYPPLARRHGWQGQVQLGFSVAANGMIDNVHVQRGSGYAILDESAQAALNRIKQLRHVQQWLNGEPLQLQLSVVYRLHGG